MSALTDRGSTRRWRKLRQYYAQTLPQPCAHCGKTVQPGEPWDLDHTVARVHGGDDRQLQISHPHCNRSRGATIRRDVATYSNPDW